MQDFSTWEKYPFTVDGVDFVSLINPKGSMYQRIKQVPVSVFNQMNQSAMRDLIGKVSLMSKSEIQDELDRVNDGYTQAYIALV